MLTGARPGLHGADAQPLRHHRPDLALARCSPRRSRRKAKASPLTQKVAGQKPVYAVRHQQHLRRPLLQRRARARRCWRNPCDRIHFDEAWYGYARFNPMYENHFAMRGDPGGASKGPTVFATHSTHKLLAALSQASYIHVRDGKGAIDHHRFNQAYMMHTTTSPLYASSRRTTSPSAMMDGSGGRSLTQEVINEAVDFRQAVGRMRRELREEERLVLQAVERRTGQGRRSRKRRRSRTLRPSCSAPSQEPLDPAAWRQLARLR